MFNIIDSTSDVEYNKKSMIRKEKFITGEHYHIYSRTILNVPEFKNNSNAKKLHQAFLLGNSTNSGQAFGYLRDNKDNPKALEKAIEISQKGKKLVDILCYSIMPDHYHLLLKELKNNGVTDFVRRCNTSIAKYINVKNNRLGSLFESNFKAKHIDTNEYLLHLSVYINLNPLDFISGKEWRFNKLKKWALIKQKLINYPWSSAKFFLNEHQHDLILSGTEIILSQFKNTNDYERFVREWSESEVASTSDVEYE